MCQGSRRNSASRCEGSAGKPSLPSITSISCKMGGKPPHFTHAPPLLRKAEAAAAPRWEPKVPRGLVAPAQSAKARLLRQKLIAVCFLRKPRPGMVQGRGFPPDMRVVNSGRPGGGGRPRVKTGKRRFDSARPRQQAGHDLPLIPPLCSAPRHRREWQPERRRPPRARLD